jgi:hypothetical protein
MSILGYISKALGEHVYMSIISIILLLLIRGPNGGTTLTLTRHARKKINHRNSHNN